MRGRGDEGEGRCARSLPGHTAPRPHRSQATPLLEPRAVATRGAAIRGVISHRELLRIEASTPSCYRVRLGHVLRHEAEKRDEVGADGPVYHMHMCMCMCSMHM